MARKSWLPGCGLALVLLASAATAPGQQWANEMFDHTSYDFRTVARGAKVEHRFTIENVYVEDAHIASVQSSCGCTAPQLTKDFLKTWDKAELIVTVDTRQFLGARTPRSR